MHCCRGPAGLLGAKLWNGGAGGKWNSRREFFYWLFHLAVNCTSDRTVAAPDRTVAAPDRTVVSAHSSSNSAVLNFSVLAFSFTTRIVRSSKPSLCSASISIVTFTAVP